MPASPSPSWASCAWSPEVDVDGVVERMVERLLAKALAYGGCARLLSPSCGGTVPQEAVEGLQRGLVQLGLREEQEYLRAFLEDVELDPDGYRAEFLRVFERGVISPYEASQSGPGPHPMGGPNVQLIADVAGFYRAFGFEARGERPDHLSAQLEFLALVCVQEAGARLAGLEEQAEVCARARQAFLQDHLAWLPSLAERIREASPRTALHHLVTLVRQLVAAEAHAQARTSLSNVRNGEPGSAGYRV